MSHEFAAEPTAPLTDKQRRIFNWMVQFTLKNFYQPSYQEIQEHFDIKSPNGVRTHLRLLQRKGLIRMANGNSRSMIFLRRQPVEGF